MIVLTASVELSKHQQRKALHAILLMKKKTERNPTYDADLHRRWPCPNAVGCITHVCTLHVICERPFKDEDIVSNLSVAWYWAINPNK